MGQRAQLQAQFRSKCIYDAVLFDQPVVDAILDFYATICCHLVTMVTDDVQICQSNGTKQECVSILQTFPEFFLEDLKACLNALVMFHPDALQRYGMTSNATEGSSAKPGGAHGGLSSILNFAARFLSDPSLLNNPHMKGCLADVVFALTPLQQEGSTSISGRPRKTLPGACVRADSLGGMFLAEVITTNPNCRCLPESMLRAFVEVERMGGSNQFFDKFNARSKITAVIAFLWESSPVHKEAFRTLGI